MINQILQKEPLGLVLSGGGALGMAHIGVIKVMEEIGISADYVSGTSVGALVGAFYAAGYSADEILDFFIKTPIFRFHNLAIQKAGMVDVTKLIPAFQPYFPENNFESLKRKFFVTATDLLTPKEVVFAEGKLIERILASSAMPPIFTPIKMDGSIFGDGAIVNNLPLEPLAPHCSKTIGVYLNPLLQFSEKDINSNLRLLERANHISTALPCILKLEQCDISITPHKLTSYYTLDMTHISDIYQIGYDSAKKMIPEFKKLKREKIG
jgi:NTE family protein